MSDPAQSVSLIVNGALVSVAPETTVAAAVLMAGTMTRTSVVGEPRGPLCGMGICLRVPRDHQWCSAPAKLPDSVY